MRNRADTSPGLLGSLYLGCRDNLCAQGAHLGFPDIQQPGLSYRSQCLGIPGKGLRKTNKKNTNQNQSSFLPRQSIHIQGTTIEQGDFLNLTKMSRNPHSHSALLKTEPPMFIIIYKLCKEAIARILFLL